MREPAKAGDSCSPLFIPVEMLARYSFLDAVARFTGSLHISFHPGVPLRSTPGSILSPPLRVRLAQAGARLKFVALTFYNQLLLRQHCRHTFMLPATTGGVNATGARRPLLCARAANVD
jgi:hypothetical protein